MGFLSATNLVVVALSCWTVGISYCYQLRVEREPINYLKCDKHNMRIWYTPDKLGKVVYAHFTDTQTETEEFRIFNYPKNDAEKAVQHYFLTKEFPFVNLFLDDPDFKPHFNQELIHEKWKRILRQVSSWMLEHKYLETDPRVFKKFSDLSQRRFLQRPNYRHFPAPVLKDFHPIVQEQCEQGLLFCLKVVHEYAYAHAQQFNKYLNSDHSYFLRQYQQLLRGKKRTPELVEEALRLAKSDYCAVQGDLSWTWSSAKKFEPFLSRTDLYEFRTTASYYLCNYTLAQRAKYGHLNWPGAPEDYWASSGTGKYKALDCLWGDRSDISIPRTGAMAKVYRRIGVMYTMASMDGYQCNKIGACQIPITGKVGRKWEDDDMFGDFSCAMLAFCPDPCCGAYKNPVEDPQDIEQCQKGDPKFPCPDGAQNDDCNYDVQSNDNFSDLVQNRVNITCGCNEKEGKKWDSLLGMCFDVDECEDSNPCHAHSEVCVNRLHGVQPLCVCEFGFRRNEITKTCDSDTDSGLFHSIIGNNEPTGDGGSSNKSEQISEEVALRRAVDNLQAMLPFSTAVKTPNDIVSVLLLNFFVSVI